MTLIVENNLTFDFSAHDLQGLTGWPNSLIDDYLALSRAVKTIINTVNDDFGTMALQNADDVAITGGSITTLTELSTTTLDVTGTATIENLVVTTLDIETIIVENLTVSGDTILGDDSSDSLTINPSIITWVNDPTHTGEHTFQGLVAFQASVEVTAAMRLRTAIYDYLISWDAPAAARALSITDPGGDDTFVFEAAAQALTNKTVDLASNTITGTKTGFDTALTDGNFAFAGGAFHDGFSDYAANQHRVWETCEYGGSP